MSVSGFFRCQHANQACIYRHIIDVHLAHHGFLLKASARFKTYLYDFPNSLQIGMKIKCMTKRNELEIGDHCTHCYIPIHSIFDYFTANVWNINRQIKYKSIIMSILVEIL